MPGAARPKDRVRRNAHTYPADGGRHERRGHDDHARGPVAAARRVAAEARALGPRDAVALLRDAFDRNDLLTYASAISFQVLFAIIPLALFGLGLLGGSGLQDVWTSDLAPKLREATSPPAYAVIDDTVRRILGDRQLFWVTAGALLATWKVSGAVRAVMGVLDSVYATDAERSFRRRMAVSLGLGVAMIVLALLAVGTMEIAPRLVHGGFAVDILRWPVTAVILWAAVTLIVRVAPSEQRPAGRVTFGSTLVIVAWLVTSAVFAWYLTNVADYGSVFGALATVVVVLTYLYISTIAFLIGVQLDALVQERLTRSP